MKIIGIIPARYASTRFPGKPLVDINGKTMIQRVYEQASSSDLLSKVVVATDDDRIYNHVQDFGGNALMTDVGHTNGTTRCNEIVSILENSGESFDVVINIQGDEPMIEPEQINMVASIFNNPEAQIGTLAKKISDTKELFDQNVVKVTMSNNRKALYFSRQPIPFCRGTENDDWLNITDYYKHIGIYGYRTEILKQITNLPLGKLEMAESLEQLRWLENAINIYVDITDFESIAIDTPEDLRKLETNT